MNQSSLNSVGGVGIHRSGASRSRAAPVLTQRTSGSNLPLNNDLNFNDRNDQYTYNAQNGATSAHNNQKLQMQRRNTNGGGLSSQTQKFSFGNTGDEMATPKAVLQQKNALNLQALPQNQIGSYSGTGKGSCQTAREPVNRGASCLQTFTQRHLEAAALKQGWVGLKAADGASISTSNEGNILTFRGSRHNNESHRESLHTDRQHLQQTTFGNLGTARGKTSPGNGSAEVHVQSLIGQLSSIHNKIQSEHGFARNMTNMNSQSESTQLKISGGGNMAKYLEDHTNTAEDQKSKEGECVWDEKAIPNLQSASEVLMKTWKNQTAAANSKESSLNTTRIQHGSSVQHHKSNAPSHASSGNQWTSHHSEVGGAHQYRTERGGVATEGSGPLQREPPYPEAPGSGQTSNPVAGKGSSSVISYHVSNKSNSSNQQHPSYIQPNGLQGSDEAYDARNSEAPRLDTFVVHPTGTTTTHRTSMISSSLADVRSKFNMQGGGVPSDGGPRLTEQMESGRPRLIETVHEQDETSTNSNLQHFMQTSPNFDFSSQLQLIKETQTHHFCPWPSPFLQGGEANHGQRQIVIDQENVGLDMATLNQLKQLKSSQGASGLLQPGQNCMQSPLSLASLHKAADNARAITSPSQSSLIQRAGGNQINSRANDPLQHKLAGDNMAPPPFDRSQASRNITATMPGSQITSHIDSQDFNEFNANETKSAEDEPEDSHQLALTDLPFTERIYEERPSSQQNGDNFGSSVPNAFRKVVHQPDSLGPPTASSCLTENQKSATARKQFAQYKTENGPQEPWQPGGSDMIDAQTEIENQLQVLQRVAASGNHQGSVAPHESEQTFLHRSYLKNISANQSGKQDHKQERTMRAGDGDARDDHELDVNEDTQSTVSHTQQLQGAFGYNQRTVPRNQNAIVYDTTFDSQQYQPGPRHGAPLYYQSNNNSQNRIERSPLNEKVLIEELINNGYANHDGSYAKNRSGMARVHNGTPDDQTNPRELALAERLNQMQKESTSQQAEMMQIQEHPQRRTGPVVPLHHFTNTMPTTDGEGQEDLSERVTTRIGADEHEKSKEHSTMAEVAEETNYQAKDLPARVDAHMMELIRHRQIDPKGENRQSLRDLLELPRETPAEQNLNHAITVIGSKIASPFGQVSRSHVAQTCLHGSFDVHRKVDSELQASPSRVMDDRQPGYNSRLEQLRDGNQQLSFDKQHRQPNAVQVLFSDELPTQGSKLSCELTPHYKLAYQFTVYNVPRVKPKADASASILETFKLSNPAKPKSWSLTFTRMSTSTVASLKPSLAKLRTLFQHRLQQQPFPQSYQQRVQLIEDLARLLAHCSEGMTGATILVDSKGMRKAAAEPAKNRPSASSKSILDAFTGTSHPATSKEPKKVARSVSSRPKVHDGHHKEGELKKEKREKREKEREVKEKEVRQSTISPQPLSSGKECEDGQKADAQMGQSSGCRPNPLCSSDKRLQVPKCFNSVSNQGSCQSEQSSNVVPKIRSPETFYRDMINFKEKRDEKLTSMRKVQDSLIKSKSCLNTKRFSSTQPGELFFENISRAKKKLDTSSKSIKINLKSLAEQSNIKLFDNRDQKVTDLSPMSLDQRQELIQRLDKRSRSNQVTSSNVYAQMHEQTRNSGTVVSKLAKRTEPSSHSNRNLSQRSEMLYQDHFLRQSRLKTMQEKCVRFEAQQNLTERSQPTQKSNQILANKIALAVKTEYDKIVEEMRAGIMEKRRMEKKKRTDIVIEEISGESERDALGSKPTGRSFGTARNEERSQSTDYWPQIEGLDLQRFVQLLSRLHYLSDVNDQKIIVQERTAIRNAWQLVSHRDTGAEMSPFAADTPIANLRNLLIFLIGIENIFVESMANSKQLESQHSREQIDHSQSNCSSQFLPINNRQHRSIGYFIGQNYFLEGEQDCVKLMQGFNLLVQNKLYYQRERQRIMTKAKLTALQQTEQMAGGSFHPSINKRSDQIMLEKSQGALYTRTSQSKAESLERKESLFQHTGYTSSARGTDHLASQKLSKDSRLRKVGCKYEDFLISKAQQRRVKLEKMAKEASKDETKECTFTPQINKTSFPGVRGGRLRSRDSKSRANKENVNSQTCIFSQKTTKDDVFESLYKFAEVRREKSEDGKRQAQYCEKKQLKKQCPFKPNLSKTQKINKSVTSKIYQYKEPDLALLPVKDQKHGRKAVGGFSALTTAMISNRRVASTPRGAQGYVVKAGGLNTARDQVKHKKHVNNTAITEASHVGAGYDLSMQRQDNLSTNQLPTSHLEDNLQSPAGIVSGIGVYNSNGTVSDHVLHMQPNLTSISIKVGNSGRTEIEQTEMRS